MWLGHAVGAHNDFRLRLLGRGHLSVHPNVARVWHSCGVSTFVPGSVVNALPRPRVLVLTGEVAGVAVLGDTSDLPGTYREIASLAEVDQREWDVLVTTEPFASVRRSPVSGLHAEDWERAGSHLFVLYVFPEPSFWSTQLVDFNVSTDGEAEGFASRADTARSIVARAGVAGHEMRTVSSLPEPIQDLVRHELLPAVECRASQFGLAASGEPLEPAILRFRPFLYGPDDLVMAASYQTGEGRSVWLVPQDAGALRSWFELALAEWALASPATFPTVSSWQTRETWDTHAERVARGRLAELAAVHEEQQIAYEARRAGLEEEMAVARSEADGGAKRLLTAQGDEFQSAVLDALRTLGFGVRDMDLIWPERERREDFRVTSAEDPEWLVIADATSVAKGTQGSKISAVLGYVAKYMIDEKPTRTPGVWIVVNRFLARDPNQRGDVYREDDLDVLLSNAGLAIDSAALYLLLQHAEGDPNGAQRCRTWLRGQSGQVTVQMVRAYWAAQTP